MLPRGISPLSLKIHHLVVLSKQTIPRGISFSLEIHHHVVSSKSAMLPRGAQYTSYGTYHVVNCKHPYIFESTFSEYHGVEWNKIKKLIAHPKLYIFLKRIRVANERGTLPVLGMNSRCWLE